LQATVLSPKGQGAAAAEQNRLRVGRRVAQSADAHIFTEAVHYMKAIGWEEFRVRGWKMRTT
jgi:hypothetical protein